MKASPIGTKVFSNTGPQGEPYRVFELPVTPQPKFTRFLDRLCFLLHSWVSSAKVASIQDQLSRITNAPYLFRIIPTAIILHPDSEILRELKRDFPGFQSMVASGLSAILMDPHHEKSNQEIAEQIEHFGFLVGNYTGIPVYSNSRVPPNQILVKSLDEIILQKNKELKDKIIKDSTAITNIRREMQ